MFGVILLLTLTGICWAAEPTCSCSPFEYEEKLLTKMIRQEFLFEKLKEDMLVLQHQISDKLKDIDKERVSSKTEISEDRETLRSEFMNMVDNSTKQMQIHKEEFQTLKDAFDADTVAFFSKDVSDTTPTAGQTFVFTTTTINEGDGYNNVTGQFMAPVGGLYKFDIQLCLPPGSSNNIYFAMMANDNKIQGGVFRDINAYKCYTAGVVVRLRSGGNVFVKCDPDIGCSGSMSQSDYYWNTFSGIRIHA